MGAHISALMLVFQLHGSQRMNWRDSILVRLS